MPRLNFLNRSNIYIYQLCQPGLRHAASHSLASDAGSKFFQLAHDFSLSIHALLRRILLLTETA